jgi:hypothetical protein
MSVQDVEKAALDLSPEQRTQLAISLLSSLGELSDEESEKLWLKMAERRLQELRAEKPKNFLTEAPVGTPGHDVFDWHGDNTYQGLGHHLYLEDGKSLHIIMLHGMGLGNPELSDAELYGSQAVKNINHILQALGSNHEVKATKQSTPFDKIKMYKYEVPLEGNKKIVFHEINYAAYFAFESANSPYSNVKDSKRTLYKNDQRLIEKAAWPNKDLKTQLVTWGFADAATYLDVGKREAIIDGVEKALRSVHKESLETKGKICFITQSLGSKVLFDSLAKLYALDKKEARFFSTEHILKNTQSIYMMANQLPLLELGTEVDRTKVDRIDDWQALFNDMSNGKVRLPDQLTIVAYSDPSDLLTYPIVPTIKQFSSGTTKLNAIDVMVTNCMPILGLFINPKKAHTGHFENKTLMKYLVEGTKQ